MKNERDHARDGVMAAMLALGCASPIGIPIWAIVELCSRQAYPLRPEDILGMSDDYQGRSIVDEYRDKEGYEFSWGTLSETIYQDEDDGTWTGTFEFCPTDVLKAFPHGGMLEDLFNWMYANHPLCSPDYDGDETFGDWFVLGFTAYGQDAIAKLRLWLAMVFVPKIFPDLVSEALLIVEAAKAVELATSRDDSFERTLVEHGRFQLCGDPDKLSFNQKVVRGKRV